MEKYQTGEHDKTALWHADRLPVKPIKSALSYMPRDLDELPCEGVKKYCR